MTSDIAINDINEEKVLNECESTSDDFIPVTITKFSSNEPSQQLVMASPLKIFRKIAGKASQTLIREKSPGEIRRTQTPKTAFSPTLSIKSENVKKPCQVKSSIKSIRRFVNKASQAGVSHIGCQRRSQSRNSPLPLEGRYSRSTQTFNPYYSYSRPKSFKNYQYKSYNDSSDNQYYPTTNYPSQRNEYYYLCPHCYRKLPFPKELIQEVKKQLGSSQDTPTMGYSSHDYYPSMHSQHSSFNHIPQHYHANMW